MISANRPEVLSNIAAMQLAGCIGTPLHPLGSLDDHAYVLAAAQIDALVYDASVFDGHAARLTSGCRAEAPAGIRSHRIRGGLPGVGRPFSPSPWSHRMCSPTMCHR